MVRLFWGKQRLVEDLLARYCRHSCQSGDRSDCGQRECAFYPWHPFRAAEVGIGLPPQSRKPPVSGGFNDLQGAIRVGGDTLVYPAG